MLRRLEPGRILRRWRRNRFHTGRPGTLPLRRPAAGRSRIWFGVKPCRSPPGRWRLCRLSLPRAIGRCVPRWHSGCRLRGRQRRRCGPVNLPGRRAFHRPGDRRFRLFRPKQRLPHRGRELSFRVKRDHRLAIHCRLGRRRLGTHTCGFAIPARRRDGSACGSPFSLLRHARRHTKRGARLQQSTSLERKHWRILRCCRKLRTWLRRHAR